MAYVGQMTQCKPILSAESSPWAKTCDVDPDNAENLRRAGKRMRYPVRSAERSGFPLTVTVLRRLERFYNFYEVFLASIKVAFTSTPASKGRSMGTLEGKAT